jgi:hypothetical protein
MKIYSRDGFRKRIRRAAMAIVAGGIVAAPTVRANPSNNVVLVPPTELPALARQSGEALFLHESIDGRTLLYIEQNQGGRLAAFDVTDPAHIKGQGSVQLDTSGDRAELVRFRRDRQDAVLDFPRVKAPNLKAVKGPTLQAAASPVGNDGVTVVRTANAQEFNPILDAKQVRDKVTNAGTGTTFILTEDGLYVIRRPAVESLRRVMMISPN